MTPAGRRLIARAAGGERFNEQELTLVYNEFGVSSEVQLVALARARGWLDSDGMRPVTETQRAYLHAFEGWLRDPTLLDRRLDAFIDVLLEEQ